MVKKHIKNVFVSLTWLVHQSQCDIQIMNRIGGNYRVIDKHHPQGQIVIGEKNVSESY